MAVTVVTELVCEHGAKLLSAQPDDQWGADVHHAFAPDQAQHLRAVGDGGIDAGHEANLVRRASAHGGGQRAQL